MTKPMAVVTILPDTPDSLTKNMDEYTRELIALPWWDFSTKRFLKSWIIKAHKKRIALLDEEEQP